MKVSASHVYNKSSKELYELFTQADFYPEKFAGIGARDVEILSTQTEDSGFKITTRRQVPADVPGVLKTFLGEWNTVTQQEFWQPYGDDEYGNELVIDADGVPATITGTMLLRPEGDGCVNDVELDIVANIPLVGKALAEFIAKDSEKSLAQEFSFITQFLKG